MTTRANDLKPTVRVVRGRDEQEYNVFINERTVRMKPVRSRDPDAVVEVTWAYIYQKGLEMIQYQSR